MRKTVIIYFIIAIVFTSCTLGKKNNDSYSSVDNLSVVDNKNHPGKKLMETNCYVCHSPTADHQDRIGPPMIAIKKHYIGENTTKEEFVKAMQAWIKNPVESNAKMHGAVKRFGIMPKQHYPEETIAQIAEYMYDYDIEQPEWFEGHFNEKKGNHKGNGKGSGKENGQGKKHGMQQAQNDFQDLPYGERGLKYTLSTKKVLGKNLMETIQKKGILEALDFCNVQAYPLTDSMSVVHNASIKRVTDKPRNPNNKANADELVYMENFKKVVANGEEAKPIVKELDNKVKVYYPITTNAMCLQCHGNPNDGINPSTLARIKRLYPMDKAIGYDINEVRGIWSITFNK
ncbi:cytochrome c [Winogradskyella epiphytica]|uniref:Cytochrome c n=1 Tax=Winogradskyella epiphytica TaxID=262005 RepID=A0A2V4XGF7_9FLAO|nr:DUF3365 domain-containing protein [Winogradskyella epiphytica]PYE81944.1 cytochrome c [Winogradskyella epiphytica]GGW61634.1 hypothetical protein GCM10008085_11500 [Winogradskyella epiphytica]